MQNGGSDIPKVEGLNESKREFPGGPVIRTLHFHCRGHGSIPGPGTNIPHAAQHGQNK